MENLQDYMLLFRMELQADYQATREEENAMKKTWGEWIGGIAQSARLVSSHQLGFEGKLISRQKEELAGLHTSNSEAISGNMVLKARNLEEAAATAAEPSAGPAAGPAAERAAAAAAAATTIKTAAQVSTVNPLFMRCARNSCLGTLVKKSFHLLKLGMASPPLGH